MEMQQVDDRPRGRQSHSKSRQTPTTSKPRSYSGPKARSNPKPPVTSVPSSTTAVMAAKELSGETIVYGNQDSLGTNHFPPTLALILPAATLEATSKQQFTQNIFFQQSLHSFSSLYLIEMTGHIMHRVDIERRRQSGKS